MARKVSRLHAGSVGVVTVTSAFAALSMASPAWAQDRAPERFRFDENRLFLTLKTGAAQVRDAKFDSGISSAGVPLNGEIKSNVGFNLGFEVGALYPTGVFASAEVIYFDSGTDQFTVNTPTTSFGTGPLSGDLDGLLAFINLGYEHDTRGPIRPFVKGGLGLVRISIDDAAGPTVVTGTVSDSDIAFAGKVGAGVALDLDEGLSLIGEYAYVLGTDLDLNFSAPTQVTPFSVDYSQNLFNVGVRMSY